MQAIYDKIEGREERYELNLYIAGEDEDDAGARRTSPADPRERPRRAEAGRRAESTAAAEAQTAHETRSDDGG